MSATPTTPTPSISVMKEEKISLDHSCLLNYKQGTEEVKRAGRAFVSFQNENIMKNAFHVPDNHIVQWPNTALSESKNHNDIRD
ncbi:hypothetical protein RIR_jg856.t1 [Rhizophagus irregularis DAOM 181602=DAOM 197198]|nr:hypothetical protein RIR_jg856.t1 [Rhizophagus irregularis DAOM 181602=DAOM 197198]